MTGRSDGSSQHLLWTLRTAPAPCARRPLCRTYVVPLLHAARRDNEPPFRRRPVCHGQPLFLATTDWIEIQKDIEPMAVEESERWCRAWKSRDEMRGDMEASAKYRWGGADYV